MHRIIGAVELSLLVLAAAILDTLTSFDPNFTQLLCVAVAAVAALQTVLHLVSIVASRRLK